MTSSSTILAVASPPGRSLRGIVRVSGSDAFPLVAPHLDALPKRGMHAARLSLGSLSLPTLVLVSPGPRSYTGEDSIEIQCPGNPDLLDRIIDSLLESARLRVLDARRAEPGEFTARAYLNGRLSLTQAEGVAMVIAARSDAHLRAGQMLLGGRLGELAHAVADELAAALALVEAGIDFTDQEDVVAIAPADLLSRLDSIIARLEEELRRAAGAEQLQAIPWVALRGPPNAGKSALFNALLGRERAVVSPVAGTTRDALAEPLVIPTSHGPAEVMLIDLAGLDPDDPAAMNRLMQDAAMQAAERAELILQCWPINESADDPPIPRPMAAPTINVRTKADLAASPARVDEQDSVFVSALTGAGLEKLKIAIAARLADRAVSLAADAVAIGPRHRQAMAEALAHLREAAAEASRAAEARSLPNPELVAAAMRAALNALAELAGDITPDDILGRVFSAFCVGK